MALIRQTFDSSKTYLFSGSFMMASLPIGRLAEKIGRLSVDYDGLAPTNTYFKDRPLPSDFNNPSLTKDFKSR